MTAFTLADGRPIPFVAAWSGEVIDQLQPDPLAGGRIAVFASGQPGDGKPLLGQMDPHRQRQCMVLRRCQVCFKPLTRLWMTELLETIVDPASGRVIVVREPAACATCLLIALDACPHLRKARPAVLQVKEMTLLATFCAPSGPLAGDTRVPSAGAVSYIKAIPTRFRRVENEEFRRGARA